MISPLRILVLVTLVHTYSFCAHSQALPNPRTIEVQSGSLKLQAFLWEPKGKGPFPAVLFCPGSGSNPQPEILAPTFVSHGYVFLSLFRSGQGLSKNQGIESGMLVGRERISHGDNAAAILQLRLLEGEQLEQELSALARLRSLRNVDARRIAVVGHSFGGSLAMLIAERDHSISAVVNFGGAARSWPLSSVLRDRLILATKKITTPVFFIHAANDYSTTPGEVLDAELNRQGKPHQLKIYPPFGKTTSEGHGLIYLSIPTWKDEVFAFLNQYTVSKQ